MTIKDQISSAKAEKKLRNRQESKDSEPKTGKQMRPISKDQMHQMRIREGWPSNDDQSGIAGGWQEELLHAHRPGIIKAPDN